MNITKYLDTLRMCLVSLLSHKTRAILTILGITIGVMTVVGLTSLIQGLNSLVSSEFGRMGKSAFFLSKVTFGVPNEAQHRIEEKRPDFVLADADAIAAECPLVDYVAPRSGTSQSVSFSGRRSDGVRVMGSNEYYQLVQGVGLQMGHGFTNLEVEHAQYVVILGNDAYTYFFPAQDPIGKRINIGGRSFTVIGVFEKQGQMFGQSRDNMVLIPITLFQRLYNNTQMHLTILVKAKNEDDVQGAVDQVRSLMRQRRKLRFDDPDNFSIMTQDSIMNTYNQLTGVVFAAMIGVGLISLIVGGVGIMNIMLVSVTERTKEIGIRMAIGAKRSDILTQFLFESITLAIFGGVLGIAIGYIISLLIRLIVGLQASVPFWSIGLAVGFSASVGTLFGLYPAWRAAKSDPIDALRFE
jgi:putative ABC transport system permease protein